VGNLNKIDWTVGAAKEPTTTLDDLTTNARGGNEANEKLDARLRFAETKKMIAEQPSFQSPGGMSVGGSGNAARDRVATQPPDLDSALLKAIVEPDLYIARADLYRAIDLRWMLRDIKANRLSLSPIADWDLQNLIDLQLVELKDGVPRLTNAGVTAIIQRK
jgi:hypothetical protein